MEEEIKTAKDVETLKKRLPEYSLEFHKKDILIHKPCFISIPLPVTAKDTPHTIDLEKRIGDFVIHASLWKRRPILHTIIVDLETRYRKAAKKVI